MRWTISRTGRHTSLDMRYETEERLAEIETQLMREFNEYMEYKRIQDNPLRRYKAFCTI